MLRILSVLSLLPLFMLATPASAITTPQKRETCKVGADNQELTGAKRDAFIKRCMAKGNYEPPGRKTLVSKKPAAKKPAQATGNPATVPKQ